MSNLPFLLEVLIREAKQRNFILKSLFFALLYLILAIFLFNFRAFESIHNQTFNFGLKLQIYFQLLIDSFKMLGSFETTLMLIASILFGINLELVLRKLKFLRHQGSLHLTFGAGLISLFAAGCAGCGLSIASVLGIAGAIALLPLGGTELFILAIIILLFSLWYNLTTLVRVCKLR